MTTVDQVTQRQQRQDRLTLVGSGTPMGKYDMETRRMMTSSPQLPLVSSSVKEAVPGRLALSPGAQCVRGSFTEQLTILAGKPAKVHEPPAARNHGYRDRVRRVGREFCVHTV